MRGNYKMNIQIKDIIINMKKLTQKGNKKVFDKDVAALLRIPQQTFATMKKRNSVPFEEVLLFCKRTGRNPMDIFYIS